MWALGDTEHHSFRRLATACLAGLDLAEWRFPWQVNKDKPEAIRKALAAGANINARWPTHGTALVPPGPPPRRISLARPRASCEPEMAGCWVQLMAAKRGLGGALPVLLAAGADHSITDDAGDRPGAGRISECIEPAFLSAAMSFAYILVRCAWFRGPV